MNKAVFGKRVLAPWLFGAMLGTLLGACGGRSTQQAGPDSSSHWLGMCTTDGECDAGQSCLCNRCTIACSNDAQCEPVASESPGAAVAQCVDVSDCSDGPVCQLECSGDSECPSNAPHCAAGHCDVAQLGDVDPAAEDPALQAPAPQCLAQVSHAAEPLPKLDMGGDYYSFVATDLGVVGIGVGTGPEVYFTTLDSSGKELTSGLVPWTTLGFSDIPMQSLGNSVAIVSAGNELNRAVCRIGIFDASDGSSLLEPLRYSNEPNADTVLHETNWCWLSKTADSFLALWTENASDTSNEMKAFAQRFDRTGVLQGEPIELAAGEKDVIPGLVTTDGERTTVLMNNDGAPRLLQLGDLGIETIDIDPTLTQGALITGLVAAHGGFLLRIGDGWVLADETGQKVGGPVPLDTEHMAPLGDGYVALLTEEYLVARTLDADVQLVSEPTGIGLDRGDGFARLVSSSGDSAVVVYQQDDHLEFATLGCGAMSSVPPGPAQ